MGFYRCFLAILVVISHTGVKFFGYNEGVVSVISFFLLSGYVMTLLITKHYNSLKRIPAFYLDRAARLFPQFVLYAMSSLILISFVDISSMGSAMFVKKCRIGKVALNLAILPLDFFQFPSVNIHDCQLVPQAWSLGLEGWFYVAIPLILIFLGLWGVRVITLASLAVFMLALHGVIDSDIWGYRLLPGPLFIFLAGAALAAPRNIDRALPRLVWLIAAALFVYIHMRPHLLELRYIKEVLLGLLLGVPAVALLRRVPFSEMDETFGNLSYGIFLNHFFCMWALKGLFGWEPDGGWYFLRLLAASIPLAALSYYFVERPALKWRRSLRYDPAKVAQATT